jgi:dTDP-4-dehydrorhamnose 3,5-epimerase
MDVKNLDISGLLLFTPKTFGDNRGWFGELYNSQKYREFGLDADFVQDNMSYSKKGVLRGLHYQKPNTQGKLVFVLSGAVWDVAVDLRIDSPTFGKWHGETLTCENRRQFYVPAGFAHGFVVLSDDAHFMYKCTDYWNRDAERCLRWNDPDVGIEWPVSEAILKDSDANAPLLRDIPQEYLF